jgi:hypothetical protein
MPMITLDYLETVLLDYGVTKASAMECWKICQQCYIIKTRTPQEVERTLNWPWVKKVSGYEARDINFLG